jgi:large subunit ribosomal protein L19
MKDFDQAALKKNIPELKSGYTIRVHQKIREGDKERVQTFEGLLIKVGSGFGTAKTITVRKEVDGVGVEKIFLIHSPNITKIDIAKKSRVRRAKLYFLRKKTGEKFKLYAKKEKEVKV